MSEFEAAYLELLPTGELESRVEEAHAMLEECRLCGRECRVNRLESTKGAVCRTGEQAVVSSFNAHFGEEDPLVGQHGSGTIFFTNCNLKCQFCQNYEISQLGEGREVSAEEIAGMMLHLQGRGCHNINFVSPTHVIPQIMAALLIAAQKGLRVPLVHNTGGYDSLEALSLLDGIVDIYMPDMKYAEEKVGRKYSKVKNYPQVNQAAVREMHRQVGDLVTDEQGIAQRGLLVRHLVLPNGLAGTSEIVRFLAEEISPETYVNVMSQYRPTYKAHEYPDIDRRPTMEELERAVSLAQEAGLTRLDERRPRLVWLLR
ncbi:MAG: radical SAM protein [Anaerolineae bacterium]|nr:radical SAM protein [Anaerolineae bacterium]NIN95069.1 radical SAM protein [Anaerolineae bacterium]NIQ78108.1 radical SAM protein [Anaerolineae bacterium]